jgi:hypothetical protein
MEKRLWRTAHSKTMTSIECPLCSTGMGTSSRAQRTHCEAVFKPNKSTGRHFKPVGWSFPINDHQLPPAATSHQRHSWELRGIKTTKPNKPSQIPAANCPLRPPTAGITKAAPPPLPFAARSPTGPHSGLRTRDSIPDSMIDNSRFEIEIETQAQHTTERSTSTTRPHMQKRSEVVSEGGRCCMCARCVITEHLVDRRRSPVVCTAACACVVVDRDHPSTGQLGSTADVPEARSAALIYAGAPV